MKYSPSEIDAMLAGMQIIVDTREQDTPALRKRIAGFGCPAVRAKLDFGDYSVQFTMPDGTVQNGQNIAVVERKMSLDELANCFTQGRKRYQREFERAKQSGTKIHLIVEGADWEKLYNGKYRSRFLPQSFVASHLSWAQRYGIQLHFCKAETTPKLIHDILKYSLREWLLEQE